MGRMKVISRIFLTLGLAMCALTLCLGLLSRNAAPVLLRTPEAAEEQVDVLMEAVCRGDYRSAGAALYGQPELGMDQMPESPVARRLQEMYRDSLSYTPAGACYASGSGLAMDIRVTALDTQAMLERVAQRTPELLTAMALQAGDNAVLDENGGYTENFIQEVLCAALEEAWKEGSWDVERELTLELVRDQGSWRILPEQGLLNLISGVME